jgi:hypothetical protein
MDNASVCDAMADVVAVLLRQKYEVEFKPENARIHCFAHALNLAVQAFLFGLGDAEDPEEIDYFSLHKHESLVVTEAELEDSERPEEGGETTSNLVEQMEELEAALVAEADADADTAALDEATIAALANVLKTSATALATVIKKVCTTLPDRRLKLIRLLQLASVSKKVNSSPQRRSAFREHQKKHYEGQSNGAHPDLSILALLTDVRTRWNSTYLMLCRALLLRKAIDDWVHHEEQYRETLRMTPEEWKMVEDIIAILKVCTPSTAFNTSPTRQQPFNEITLQLSRSTPTLQIVLPCYQQILRHLDNWKGDRRFNTAIDKAKSKIEKYHTMALKNQYYVIATSEFTHPIRPKRR